jgi:hypothetical protein
MTEQTDDTAGRLVNSLLAETDQERAVSCGHAIRRLSIAVEAVQLAVTTVGDAPHRASLREWPTSKIIAHWHASNLMSEAVFSQLNYVAHDAIEMMRRMMPPR